MGKQKLVHWNFTRGWELLGIAVMLGMLMALFQETSLFRLHGIEWSPHLWSGLVMPGIVVFWTTIIIFHIALFTVVARSIVGSKQRTANWVDFVAGFLAIFGIYLILISTIYWLYKGQLNIEFMGDIPSIYLLRTGFIIEAIACIWFGVTE